jgi:hypothetical protein
LGATSEACREVEPTGAVAVRAEPLNACTLGFPSGIARLRYQAGDYSAAAHLLPGSSPPATPSPRTAAATPSCAVQSQVYVAVTKLVTKVGDGHLAWLAAYQVACAFLKLDRLDQAEHITLRTDENVLDDTPNGLSVQGALFLVGAVSPEAAATTPKPPNACAGPSTSPTPSAPTPTTDGQPSAPPTSPSIRSAE